MNVLDIEIGSMVRITSEGKFVYANFEAFSSDYMDVLVSVSGYPKQHVGVDEFYWVPVNSVLFCTQLIASNALHPNVFGVVHQDKTKGWKRK